MRQRSPDHIASSPAPRIHTITVDVEEYYHATNIEAAVPPRRWHSLPSRVEESTNRLLALFERFNARGTFFILGAVARRHPALVRAIQASGHEIASHGYAHRLVYDQNRRQFARDVSKSKALLEDLIGEQVIGYRAPNFSITDRSPWAYDELLRAGYLYDSSRYPVFHPRYANADKPMGPEIIVRPGSDGSPRPLAIFPLVAAELRVGRSSFRLPVAGGAYWRLFPRALMLWGLRRAEQQRPDPLCCYLHPWEIDGGQPAFSLPLGRRIRHYTRLSSFEQGLETFLKTFRFEPLRETMGKYLTGRPT